ncbi:MAG: biotin/lipoyl-containing protein [Patescibacteria group bacterium]
MIKEIIGWLEAAGLAEAEIEITEGRSRFHLKYFKGCQSKRPHQIKAVIPTSAKSEEKPVTEQAAEVIDENLIKVVAPIEGIFYQALSEDYPPLVEVGKTIQRGDNLCVIELMKSKSFIDSKIGGVIVEILVKDKQEVKEGQVLFLVKSPT